MMAFGLLLLILIGPISAEKCSHSFIFCVGLVRESSGKLQRSFNCSTAGECELRLKLEYNPEGSFVQFNVEELQSSSLDFDLNFAFSSKKQANLTDLIIFGYKKHDRRPTYIHHTGSWWAYDRNINKRKWNEWQTIQRNVCRRKFKSGKTFRWSAYPIRAEFQSTHSVHNSFWCHNYSIQKTRWRCDFKIWFFGQPIPDVAHDKYKE